ncbi:MAG: ferredoxin [Caldithrix sp.]|nr:ferredoxin [Caldithrix sp.]
MNFKNSHEMGSGGRCLCPRCAYTKNHERGRPCQDQRCPECGAKLLREGSYHHRLIEQKKHRKD